MDASGRLPQRDAALQEFVRTRGRSGRLPQRDAALQEFVRTRGRSGRLPQRDAALQEFVRTRGRSGRLPQRYVALQEFVRTHGAALPEADAPVSKPLAITAVSPLGAAQPSDDAAAPGDGEGVAPPTCHALRPGIFHVPAAIGARRADESTAWVRVLPLTGHSPAAGGHAWLRTAPLRDVLARVKPWAVAEAYAGVQFGVWVPRLGDGRAAAVCSVVDPGTGGRVDVNAKGVGKTAFARGLDGKMAVRSAAWEYAAAGVIHGRGGDASQVLSLHVSDETCFREGCGFERCAALLRTAPTWARVGTVQHHAYHHGADAVRDLILHLRPAPAVDAASACRIWFADFAARLGRMAGWWMAYGLYHGCLNSDNVSLHGIALDLTHCEFLATLDEAYCANKADEEGRYRFGAQPEVLKETVAKLARQLAAVGVGVDEEAAGEGFCEAYVRSLHATTLRRWGVTLPDDAGAELRVRAADAVAAFRCIVRDEHLPWWGVHAALLRRDFTLLRHHPAWLAQFEALLRACPTAHVPRRPLPDAPPDLKAVPGLAKASRWGDIADMIAAYDTRA